MAQVPAIHDTSAIEAATGVAFGIARGGMASSVRLYTYATFRGVVSLGTLMVLSTSSVPGPVIRKVYGIDAGTPASVIRLPITR